MKTAASTESGLFPRVLWPYRAFAAVGIVLLAAAIVYFVLLSNSYLSDNAYNLSLALRSASPDAKYFIESGAADLIQHLELPRPENWHRTLAIIFLKYWSILTRSTRDTIWMRLPHLVFVFLWLALSLKLLGCLADEGSPEGAKRHPGVWALAAVAFLCLLTISPWGVSLLINPYLDEVPSSVVVLVALMHLMRNPASAGRAAVCGALCGLAYLLKDLCVFWVPTIMCAFGLYFVVTRARPPLKRIAACAAAFTACFVLVVSPRWIWDYYELGGLFQNAGLYWIRAYYFGPPEKSAAYPFSLYGDTTYTSAFVLRGGVLPVLRRILEQPVVDATKGMLALGFAWWWLIPWGISARRRESLGDGARFLLCVLLIFLTAFYAFLAIGWGDMSARYYIVPVTLAFAFGIDGLLRLMHRPGFGKTHAALWAAFLAVGGVIQSNPYPVNRDQTDYLITPQEAHALASHVRPGEVVLTDYIVGSQFYCLEWNILAIALMPHDFLALGDAQIERLLSWYPIKYVYYPPHPLLVQRLAQWGFAEKQRYGPNVLYVRERSISPATSAAMRRGADLERDGKLDEARDFYAALLRDDPSNPHVRLALANLLVGQKQVDAAVEQYQTILRSDPKNRDALFDLGAVLAAAGRTREAAEPYTRLLEIDPRDADVHVRLGDILKSQGLTEEAARHYKAALEINPDHPQARQ